ncbi:hypothetical protein NGA_0627220, partial [Nannochloropsis gaditana CCMP526]|uniref:uncharacterized protein n=1 Tax=Nannochloropsis gaditana (strain CCMP526) TaxID=1093141 RepID=UPI00029F6883
MDVLFDGGGGSLGCRRSRTDTMYVFVALTFVIFVFHPEGFTWTLIQLLGRGVGRFLSPLREVPAWKRELHLAAGVMVVWSLGVLARHLFRVLGTERQSGLKRKGPAEPGMLAAQVSHSPAGEEGGLGAKSKSQEWTLTPSTPAPPHPGRKARRKKGSGGGKRAAGGKAAPLGGLPGPGETAGAPGVGEGGRVMEEA